MIHSFRVPTQIGGHPLGPDVPDGRTAAGRQPGGANAREPSGPEKRRTAFQTFMSEQMKGGKKSLKEAQAAWREHKAGGGARLSIAFGRQNRLAALEHHAGELVGRRSPQPLGWLLQPKGVCATATRRACIASLVLPIRLFKIDHVHPPNHNLPPSFHGLGGVHPCTARRCTNRDDRSATAPPTAGYSPSTLAPLGTADRASPRARGRGIAAALRRGACASCRD